MSRSQAARREIGLLAAFLLVLSAVITGAANAAPRDQVLETLGKVSPGWSDLGLEARVNDGGSQVVRVGDEVRYVFGAKADAHLTVLHVDSHGVISVLYPSAAYPGNRIAAGLPNSIPAGSDLALEVSPPMGREDVFVYATREAVTLADLGLSDATPLAVVDVADAPAFAARVAEVLSARSGATGANMAAAHVPLRVVGRGDLDMTKEDILAYFTVQTRALRRPKIDLQVHFDSGSHVLDQAARDQLDQMGMALQELDETFVIGGHTDDVGEAEYNRELSRRRAEAVRGYLESRYEIPSERLRVEAYGEEKPLEADVSSEARAANRRVEFELIR